MQTSSTPAAQLNQELDAARELLDLLRQEQAQLVTGEIDSLNAITAKKTVVIARMAELATSRHRALAAAGFAADEAGMKAWLQRPEARTDGDTVAAGKFWVELLTLAQSANQLNRTNGVLINTHMTRNQAALNVLQGSPQGGNLYGPDGQASKKTEARNVVVG